MKATQMLVGALALAGLAAPLAGARSTYLPLVKAQYHLERDAAIAKANCQYCHVNAFGGAGWNPYGNALREVYQGEAKRNVGDALYLVLRANKDSDADGYADALEVVAKTLPGDAKSKPIKTKAALEAELRKLGGVDYFKAKAGGN